MPRVKQSRYLDAGEISQFPGGRSQPHKITYRKMKATATATDAVLEEVARVAAITTMQRLQPVELSMVVHLRPILSM